jgi:hypothetical protein
VFPDLRPRSSLLPEDIGLRIDEMRKACPGIEQVWLLRHRPEPPEWDLLAFGDSRSLDTLRGEGFGRRPDMQLLVVVDGDRFEPAWGKHPSGNLRDIDWRIEDADTATFAPRDAADAATFAPSADASPAAPRMTAVRVR